MASFVAHSLPCSRCSRSVASRNAVVARAEPTKIPETFKQISPRGALAYVRVQQPEELTKGGIYLPESSKVRPTSGQVVSLGDGRLPNGNQMEFTVKPGDEVLYSKFGFAFTELAFQGDEYLLIKEADIIGVMPKANAIADDIPELQPLGDRVLIRVTPTADVSAGGVMMMETSKERPLSGEVVAAGPGRMEDDGTRADMPVAPGDTVVYFKYAGDNMETSTGELYVVVHVSDILCKL